MSWTMDFDEQACWEETPNILRMLLLDRATGNNILWATDEYAELGDDFAPQKEITPELITGKYAGIIKPRVLKMSDEERTALLNKEPDLHTDPELLPAWRVNEHNNLMDVGPFRIFDKFNVMGDKCWKTTTEPVTFESIEFGSFTKDVDWKDYIRNVSMPVRCGEGPHLASPYDTLTGERIELSDRIGRFDRKMRLVNENCTSEEEWLVWARRAVEYTQGFELRGDKLLIARENLLSSYQEYREAALGAAAKAGELLCIAEIISWSIWQMDPKTNRPPYQTDLKDKSKLTLCVTREWEEDGIYPWIADEELESD